MNNDIQYDNYEKMSDDIMYLGYNTVFRMNVILATKDEKTGNRKSFHNEFQYKTSKYNNMSSSITIRRSFKYYLTIETIKKDEFGEKEFIQISMKDLYHFKYGIAKACEWFTNPKYKNLFAKKDGKIIVMTQQDPIVITGLSMDKFLKLIPITINDEHYQSVGVRMLLSSEDKYVDMNPDVLLSLRMFLETFNPFMSAQLMLAYIQRPAYGTHTMTFCNCDSEAEEMEEPSINAKTTRQIPVKKKQKSIFDSIDLL